MDGGDLCYTLGRSLDRAAYDSCGPWLLVAGGMAREVRSPFRMIPGGLYGVVVMGVATAVAAVWYACLCFRRLPCDPDPRTATVSRDVHMSTVVAFCGRFQIETRATPFSTPRHKDGLMHGRKHHQQARSYSLRLPNRS